MKIGIGYDAHRLVEGRPLILGGVCVPHKTGLQGHSDADVLAHAVIDALLGAAGLGDIGRHFPDTDVRYQGADSLALLRCAGEKIAPLRVGNIDAVILAQRPKLAAFLPEMAANLAAALGLASAAVNVKATTEEGMGFTGREEGIAAKAVCILT